MEELKSAKTVVANVDPKPFSDEEFKDRYQYKVIQTDIESNTYKIEIYYQDKLMASLIGEIPTQ